MSFFSEASLAMIPSGYKTSKVYSAVPTSGDGDLTFSRSNDTATRVGPDGLIEKVRTNRFTYSQDLSNAAWKTVTDGGSITKTANAGTAPDGTNTATRVQVAGGGTYTLVYQDNVNPLGSVVVSGYFKRYGGTNQTFRLFGDNGSALSGTLTATDTWQRFSFTMTASSAGADGLAADASNNAYDILVWGMQLETGDIATDYIATTSAAVTVGPVANVPRLDYLDSSSPRLLLEPQRTNSFTYSEQFDNAAWSKVSATITANTTISPDGYQNADTFTTTGGGARISQSLSLGAGTYTASLYVKKLSGSGDMRFFGVVDGSGVTQSFTPTDTWQRFTGNFTASTGITEMQLRENGFTGTLAIYGFQLEAGAYATSYIPTLGAAVTRGADAASKTGISSLIGQTEGTLYLEFSTQPEGNGDSRISISDGTTNNWVFLSKEGPNYRAFVKGSGSVAYSNIAEDILDSSIVKMAIAYKSNDIAYYFNGTQRLSTDSISFSGTLDRLIFGNNYAIGDVNESIKISQALLFTSRLSNDDLATLTTI